MKNNLWLIISLLVAVLGCDQPKSGTQNIETEAARLIQVPAFNSDSAVSFIRHQLDFGPRVPNTQNHRNCRDYLADRLRGYGAELTIQEFEEYAYDGTLLQLSNLIASFQPKKSKRILLAAHWDTRPWADKDPQEGTGSFEGANDNASGVAVLLEIGRLLSSSNPPEVGIDLIFFDGEDYGMRRDHSGTVSDPHGGWCLGSRYWSSNKHQPRYSAFYGILLDMVGAKNARFFQEGASMEYAPSVVRRVWTQASRIGYGDIFVASTRPPITDDHVFINQTGGIPTIDIVQYDPTIQDYFGAYHHTLDDNIEIIDPATLQAVGQTVLQTIYYEPG